MPWHAPVLASAFVINVAFANQVQLPGLVRPLLVSLIIALTLVAVLSAALRSSIRGGLAATSVILVLVSLDAMRSVVEIVAGAMPGIAGLAVSGVIFLGAFGLLGVVLLRAWRRRTPAAVANTRANQGAALLLAAVLITVIVGAFGSLSADGSVPQSTSYCGLPPEDRRPDIYQILLDGYPRADVLLDQFHFDNGSFVEALRQRGFSVDDASHSNYNFTALTFASMFNMEYLDSIPGVSNLLGEAVGGRSQLRSAIEHGRVFDALRRAGYATEATASGWEHVSLRQAVDRFHEHGELTDFERNLVERTWLPELLGGFGASWVAGQQRARVTNGFDDLAAAAESQSQAPRWFFAHIPLPHLPFAFDQDETPALTNLRQWGAESHQWSDDQYGPKYGRQLAVLNELVLRAVDRVIAAPESRPMVIIIMSDHGYSHDARVVSPRTRLSNLFAVRLPAGATELPPATPVNLYRELGQRYLGLCESPLPNRYFVSSRFEQQLELEEVGNPDVREVPSQ